MKLIAINVGRPREYEWQGKTVRTSIFKAEVAGPVRVGETNLEGDEQSDLTVHGGPNKAVYLFPSEHFAYWREMLPGTPLPWGAFGENLDIEGLLEPDMNIGDHLRIGTAEFRVMQPRSPCFKLGLRFDRPDMTRLFFESERFGTYVSVVREGVLQAGDPIELLSKDARGLTVQDMVQLETRKDRDLAALRRAIEHPLVSEGRRERYRKQLSEATL